MQAELASEGHDEINILGINGIGLESGNEEMCNGRTLPWLQDVPEEDVWSVWPIEYRDVLVLDGENRPVATYNLTEHSLGDADSFATLKALLIDAESSLRRR